MVFPALGEKNVAKRSDENDKKKLVGCLDRSNRERERKSVWNFWKVFKHVQNQGFKKNSLYDFRLIEK